MDRIINLIQLKGNTALLISDIIQLVIIYSVLYYVIKSIRNTRAWILAKGIAIVFIIYSVVSLFKLSTIEYIMQQVFQLVTIAIILMFQPELQKLFEQLGKQDFKSWYNKIKRDKDKDFRLLHDNVIEEITDACTRMAAVKTGALIVIERDIPLTSVIDSGIDVNADTTAALLINIFEKNTPLHDGAVVIKNNKVRAATCYLPLTKNNEVQKSLGTRHRAAIGISETTDALVIVVSEETGSISLCENGKISHGISAEMLSKKLQLAGNRPTAEQEVTKHLELNFNKIKLRVIVALASIVLWISINTTQDPITTITLNNIPVSITNDEVLDTIGQTYQVISGDTVSVQVSGRKSIVSNIKASDIQAIANFKKLSQIYSVPIEVSSKTHANEVDVRTKNSDVMVLELEELVEKEIIVTRITTGTPKEGKLLTIESLDTDKVKVVAPESKAKNIAYATVTVNVDDKDSDFITFVTPVLYDADGQEIDMSGVEISNEDIKVSLKALNIKEVPIELNAYSSSDSVKYDIISYELDKDKISVAGTDEELDKLDKIVIDFDLTTSSDEASTTILNMADYISDKLIPVSNDDWQVSLKIEADKFIKTSIPITIDKIKVEASKDANIELLKCTPYLYCYIPDAMSEISIEMLEPKLVVSNTKAGEYTTAISFTNIDGITFENKPTVSYKIAK